LKEKGKEILDSTNLPNLVTLLFLKKIKRDFSKVEPIIKLLNQMEEFENTSFEILFYFRCREIFEKIGGIEEEINNLAKSENSLNLENIETLYEREKAFR
jgi:hypothetical protein